MGTQMVGFIFMGMRSSEIDLYFININLPSTDYRGTFTEEVFDDTR